MLKIFKAAELKPKINKFIMLKIYLKFVNNAENFNFQQQMCKILLCKRKKVRKILT